MIKIFTTNKNGRIELSPKELKELLDDSYWEGYRANSTNTWTYTYPTWSPYIYCNTGTSSSIKLNTEKQPSTTISANDLSGSITLTSSNTATSNNVNL